MHQPQIEPELLATMPPAIQVENLAKSTLVGSNNARPASAATALQTAHCKLMLTTKDSMKAIQVENLGKSYLVGHNNAKAESYTALRDVLARNAKNLARKTRDMVTGRQIVQGDEVEEFWALKDITTKSSSGDRLGITGRKGARKSTGLKILSRMTEPTTGRVTINGRVASLLEVGTGLHPELTGRENIVLNGASLGMGRKEIQTVG